jgi:hypothetical protein
LIFSGLIFSALAFLGLDNFIADFFAGAAFGLAAGFTVGFTVAVFAGIAVLAKALFGVLVVGFFAAGLTADLDGLVFAADFATIGFAEADLIAAGLAAVGATFVVLGVVVSDMELS